MCVMKSKVTAYALMGIVNLYWELFHIHFKQYSCSFCLCMHTSYTMMILTIVDGKTLSVATEQAKRLV